MNFIISSENELILCLTNTYEKSIDRFILISQSLYMLKNIIARKPE